MDKFWWISSIKQPSPYAHLIPTTFSIQETAQETLLWKMKSNPPQSLKNKQMKKDMLQIKKIKKKSFLSS